MSAPSDTAAETAPGRPLRADAARNRERILEAADELFALRGLGVALNEIARHAGVGVGTVYRHFPDKDQLTETLLQERVEGIVAVVEESLADPDPWHGFVSSLERVLELQAADRGLRELVVDSPAGLERAFRVRSRMLPVATELLRRAQAAGAVRPDVETSDLAVIQMMVCAVIEAARDVDPTLWRRYLAMMLRSLAAHPDEINDLPGTALSPEDLDRVMTAAPTLRRR